MSRSGSQLERVIAAMRKRLFIADAIRLSGLCLTISAAAALALTLANLFVALGLPGWAIAMVALSGMPVACAIAWRRRSAGLGAAVLLDDALRLKDRLGTAIALSTDASMDRDNPMSQWVHEDAERLAAKIDPRAAANVSWPMSWGVALLLGLSCVPLLLFVSPRNVFASPPPTPEQVAALDARQQAAEAVRQRAEELRKIDASDKEAQEAADSDAKQQALDTLDRLARQLDAPTANSPGGAGSGSSSDAQLSSAAHEAIELANRLDQQSQIQREAQKRAIDGLSEIESPSTPGDAGEFAQSLKEGDLEAAQQWLEGLEDRLKNAPPEEREALANSLRQTAEQIKQAADRKQSDANAAESPSKSLEDLGLTPEQMKEWTENPPSVDEIRRELQDKGQDPIDAQQLAEQAQRDLAQRAADEKAKQQLDETAKRVSDLADSVEQPPPPQPQPEPNPDEEPGEQPPKPPKEGAADQPGQSKPEGATQPSSPNQSKQTDAGPDAQKNPDASKQSDANQPAGQEGNSKNVGDQSKSPGDQQPGDQSGKQGEEQDGKSTGEQAKPGEQTQPGASPEAGKGAPEGKPGETAKPDEAPKPGDTGQPAEGAKPGESTEPGKEGQTTPPPAQAPGQSPLTNPVPKESNEPGATPVPKEGAPPPTGESPKTGEPPKQGRSEPKGEPQPGEGAKPEPGQSGEPKGGEPKTGQSEPGAKPEPAGTPDANSPAPGTEGGQGPPQPGAEPTPVGTPDGQSPGAQSTPAGDQAEDSTPGAGGAPGEGVGDKAKRLREMLDQIDQSGKSADQGQEISQTMRDTAKDLLERMSPEEREELKRWAEEKAKENGAGNSGGVNGSPDSLLNRTLPTQAVQNPRLFDYDTQDVDLTKKNETPNDRVIAEMYGSDQKRADGAIDKQPMNPEQVRQAAKAIERALNEEAIPPRYRALIRNWARRLPKAEQPAPQPTGETSKP